MKNVRPPSTASRWPFVLGRVLRVVEYVLVIDFSQSYMHLPVHEPGRSIATYAYLPRFFYTLTYGMNAYAVLNLQYEIAAGVNVALGLSQPKAWPPMFGNWADAYTVRNLWGYVLLFFTPLSRLLT